MPECAICTVDWAWEPEHDWTNLGRAGHKNEVFMLCEMCTKDLGTNGDFALLKLHTSYVVSNGCCLHVTLEDYNVDDDSIKFCKEYAVKKEHALCARVADYLATIPAEQRKETIIRSRCG